MDESSMLVGTGHGHLRTVHLVDDGPESGLKLEQHSSQPVDRSAVDVVRRGHGGRLLVATRAGSLFWYDLAEATRIASVQVVPQFASTGKDYLWLLAEIWPDSAAAVTVENGIGEIVVRDLKTLVARNQIAATKSRLRASAFNPRAGIVAVGGEGYEPELFHCETSASLFKGRSTANDNPYAVRRPPCVTAAAFGSADSKLLFSGLDSGRLRVYDPSSGQRRPLFDIGIGEGSPISCLSPGAENELVVGNNNGRLALMDVRKPGSMLGVYRNAGTGGLSGVETRAESGLLVSFGLDRFLRVHDYSPKTRIPTARLQQKHPLTSICVPDQLRPRAEAPPRDSEDSSNSKEDAVADIGGDDANEGFQEDHKRRRT